MNDEEGEREENDKVLYFRPDETNMVIKVNYVSKLKCDCMHGKLYIYMFVCCLSMLFFKNCNFQTVIIIIIITSSL